MYRNFFSLSELPFSISPNPKYLFMSDRHKEALAHLTYGLGETGGFALLTGEVGTGKTTISRCLLAQLPDNTQTAFILNPTLSSQELLATICDQLLIPYHKEDASLKYLTDKISEKLLQNHQDDMNTLLIIDEAQHLQVEVLEQLRLLTNLETDTKKLLQVILIGQPELQQLLQRRDLRQLAQRITARYHLMPLTKKELVEYIKHRLFIADCHRNLFSSGALAKIHQLSQGIPRLINLLCHGALMHAYNNNDSVVSKSAVKKSAEQTLGGDLFLPDNKQNNALKLSLIVSMTCLLTITVAIGFTWNKFAVTLPLIASEKVLSNKGDSTLNEQQDSRVAKTESTTAPIEDAQLNSSEIVSHSNSNKTSIDKEDVLSHQKTIHTSNDKKQNKKQAPIEIEKNNTIAVETNQNYDDISTVEESLNSTQHDHVSENSTRERTIKKQDIRVKRDEDLKDVSDVSPELLALFKEAIEETNRDNYSDARNKPLNNTYENIYQDIKPVTQMPAWFQKELPNLHFTQHIYSSDGEGWVNVNGRDRYEGDSIASGLLLDKILPQQVILTYQNKTFSLPALANW
jgi:type II secretory pathway predicted ATPase ExeA